MRFCSQLTMKNGMYTDVIALFKKYVNIQCEPQSSEEFAQFPSVGMGAGCWDSAAAEPSASPADPAAPGAEGRTTAINKSQQLRETEIS